MSRAMTEPEGMPEPAVFTQLRTIIKGGSKTSEDMRYFRHDHG
jgi:hypothetical protein